LVPLPDRRLADSLRVLRNKYREIKRLRDEHTGGSETDPRSCLRALAERFPGALRELDELPMQVIEARLSELERALDGELPAPAWAPLQLAFHGSLRAALRIKRLARGASDRVRLLAELRARYQPEPFEPSLEALGEAGLTAILSPPDGRLSRWALGFAAASEGVSERAIVEALFVRPQRVV
jgi:hypothetical protein